LFEVAAAALGERVPSDLRGPLMGVSDETMSIPSYAYTCAVCEVDVDPETGLVNVVLYASIDDCGRAVNPMLIHGQSHGGIAQGVGQALWEACVYDPRSGQRLSGSFLDYAIPRADLVPAFDTEISEVPSTTNPLGMRVGREGGITAGARRGGERDRRCARGVRRRAYRAAGGRTRAGEMRVACRAIWFYPDSRRVSREPKRI
jgi:carbon-monoxide dehydrogenase large subunit